MNFIQLAVKGVGKKTVEKIVDKFGIDTLDIITKDWKRLTEIKGIKEDKAYSIHKKIVEADELQRVFTFLMQNEIPNDSVVKIFQTFSIATIQKIKENPYSILSVRGITFLMADKIAFNLKLKANDERRIIAGVQTFLDYESENKGDLFTYKHDLMDNLGNYIERIGAFPKGSSKDINGKIILDVLKTMKDKGLIVIETSLSDKSVECIYKSYNNFVEKGIVRRLKELLDEFKKPLCSEKEINDYYDISISSGIFTNYLCTDVYVIL